MGYHSSEISWLSPVTAGWSKSQDSSGVSYSGGFSGSVTSCSSVDSMLISVSDHVSEPVSEPVDTATIR
jgi:hypothetical protein